jgi:hypothetical protein
VANLNIANFSSAELTECKIEILEGKDFIHNYNPNSIFYTSIADIQSTEIREFKPNQKEEVDNEMNFNGVIHMQEAYYYG